MTRRQGFRTLTAWLGVAAALGMFVVLVMGATVTNTGSAQGCGRDWPLCNGRFVPEFAVSAFIEWSHRVVTGAETFLIVAFSAAILTLYRRERPVQVLAPLMLAALVAQAVMGAMAVLWPQQPVVLALHFGISLIAVASTALAAAYVLRRRQIRAAGRLSASLRLVTWGVLAYLYLLTYSGAYVRHTDAAPACPGWPLCGESAGFGAAALAANLVHRSLAAIALLAVLALIAAFSRFAPERRDLVSGAWLLTGTLLAQGGAGALLVLTGWNLFGQLLHAAMTGVVFTAAAYLCLRATAGGGEQPLPAALPAARARLRPKQAP